MDLPANRLGLGWRQKTASVASTRVRIPTRVTRFRIGMTFQLATISEPEDLIELAPAARFPRPAPSNTGGGTMTSRTLEHRRNRRPAGFEDRALQEIRRLRDSRVPIRQSCGGLLPRSSRSVTSTRSGSSLWRKRGWTPHPAAHPAKTCVDIRSRLIAVAHQSGPSGDR